MSRPPVLPIQDGIDEAVAALRDGKLVVFPTDTVYGIAADPTNADAVRQLFEAKRREFSKPIPLLLADPSYLTAVCNQPPAVALRLAVRYFPGAITLIVPLTADYPSELTAGGATVGVRTPDHDATRKLIRRAGGILAVTSANVSDDPPALSADEIDPALRPALILDGGRCPGSVPSTVVDTTQTPPVVLREGALSLAELRPHF